MSAWTLGGRAIGQAPDAGIKFRSMPVDSHCSNCQDEYSERDLLGGRCFGCRYEKHLRTKGRLEVRPSWSGAEALNFEPNRGI
jgi:hypothetical protein